MNGIQERVIRARSSSNLKSDEFDRDADVLMACAFAGEPGGAIFSRLRAEFDDAHATVKREAAGTGGANIRMLTLMRLRSLAQAKQLAADIAIDQAEVLRINMSVDMLLEMAWQGLSVWLDPTCAPCGGRGFRGGYDGPIVTCRGCRGSGKRRDNAGFSADQQLLIDRVAMSIAASMGKFHSKTDSRLRYETA